MNFLDELRWRGMLHDAMPDTEKILEEGMVKGYIGFDPTADSLGVGNLVQVMTLLHFQQCGHKPIALVGGATGMVGDPSGKSSERNLLSEDLLKHNLESQRKQLEKFLNFDCGKNSAIIVNNYDWFKNCSFLDFIRDVGKHLTVNYMMAKDSVKNRLGGEGMSFTEFSYQLVQGYDFYHLWKNEGVLLQMGGSDQWGNIVTGTELIRRKDGGKAYALTTPLIKKADGTKFGKSEKGNIWLDPNRTSPYAFYQFWINAADADIKNYIRIFTLFTKEKIESLEAEHDKAPHLRLLQKALAKDITTRVHSEADCNTVIHVTDLIFGAKTNKAALATLTEQDLAAVANGLQDKCFHIALEDLKQGISILDLLAVKTQIKPSKGEARKAIQNKAIALNKEKLMDANAMIQVDTLLHGKYILIESGKQNQYMIVANA
jgi:tyrosyl-tRNA synthetase